MNVAASRKTVLLSFLLLSSLPLRAQEPQLEPGERHTNRRQPPAVVMDAIGIRPGMTVADVGAGRGRYTVFLAERVGPSGKVYAEDIDRASLDHLRERVAAAGFRNVEVVEGTEDDPGLPKGALDVVLMVLTYHHLDHPVEVLKSLAPSLKPGAIVAVVDPDPAKDRSQTRASEYTPRDKIEREAREAGYELARVDDSLSLDSIFILKRRAS